ncbi:thiamine phosphate synthase [Pseudoduganella sp. RAF53_2]|uniref:thiamine phosphate synthase n=1 Tax=unclassified Pseudoduganella TaxID=2637179 RepID=UPI003F9A1F16
MQGLYLVTPDWDDTARLLDATEQALAAGVALLQYRHKTASEALRYEQAGKLQALCRRHGTPFIINDHLALAQELDADGIHVGGTDMSVAAACAALGAGKLVGATCYGELQRAHEAAAQGASYVAFGGFYPSRVKKYAVTTAPQIVAQSRAALAAPVVVIGGMTPENAAPLVAQGAHMVAAISSVYQASDVGGAVQAFRALFGETGL